MGSAVVQATPQTPPSHVSPVAQAAALSHWPHGSHVCTLDPVHCFAPGAQTGASGHVHAPQAQPAAQDWLPYVLQASLPPGLQLPDVGTHVASPLHSVSLAGQAQTPAWQVSPPVHA